MKKYKEFKDLIFTDDFMFWSVMQNEIICRNVLNLILAKEIGEIDSIRYQEVIENLDAKGIRLDVLAKTKDGSLYNVEMQTSNKKNIPKRMRFYQASLDGASLSKGEDYNNLPSTVIIFICTFDLFRKKLPFYSFKYFCEQNKTIRLRDGTTKIVLNSKAFSKVENTDLKDFLAYVNGTKNENRLVQMIEDEIRTVKKNEELREVYMQYYNPTLMDERREGIAIGRQEGAYQKALETARVLKHLGDSTEKINKVTGLSVKEIEELGD